MMETRRKGSDGGGGERHGRRIMGNVLKAARQCTRNSGQEGPWVRLRSLDFNFQERGNLKGCTPQKRGQS